jgi:transcriptional regulator with XRE-family HTH domain
MRKQIRFQKIIKENRKLLRLMGFDDATLTLWTQGKRIPGPDNAQKLASALQITMRDIPQRIVTIK